MILYLCVNGCLDPYEAPLPRFVLDRKATKPTLFNCFGCGKKMHPIDLDNLPRRVLAS